MHLAHVQSHTVTCWQTVGIGGGGHQNGPLHCSVWRPTGAQPALAGRLCFERVCFCACVCHLHMRACINSII